MEMLYVSQYMKNCSQYDSSRVVIGRKLLCKLACLQFDGMGWRKQMWLCILGSSLPYMNVLLYYS